MKQEIPHNPLDRLNLGLSVTNALLSRDAVPLVFPEPFNGAGIYVIYYTGDFPAYRPIAAGNSGGKFEAPIYIGKAIPKGGRKGIITGAANKSLALHSRLRQHSESIKAAANLKIEDFWCRYLVVEDVWIPLGESLLIEKYTPLWNLKLDGFGNHDPGKGRYNQQKGPWDVIHPGRPFAEKLQPNSKTAEECLAIVNAFLCGNGE